MIRVIPFWMLFVSVVVRPVSAWGQGPDSAVAAALALHARAGKDASARAQFVATILSGSVVLPEVGYYSDARVWHAQDSSAAARRRDTAAVRRYGVEISFLLDKLNAAALGPEFRARLNAARAASDTSVATLDQKLYLTEVILRQALLSAADQGADTIPGRARAAAERRAVAQGRSVDAVHRQAEAAERSRVPTGRYQGQTVGAGADGKGVLTYANGDRYEGEFRRGRRHGRGVFELASGVRYEGQFADGEPQSVVLDLPSGARYTGPMVDGRRSGEGVLELATGERYAGGFANDRFHGAGRLEYADGGWYDGAWREGKRQGRGTERYASGRILSGWFESDRFVRR